MDIDNIATEAGIWLWDKFGTDMVEKLTAKTKEPWRSFNWKKASSRYRQKIKRLYGSIRIMGMSEPAPLDGVFTDVYILDKPTAFRRHDIEKLNSDVAEINLTRFNGIETVKNHKYLFILGKPGAGKTTLLKYIATSAAETKLNKIPIFIALKELSDSGKSITSFIEDLFDICDFPEASPFIQKMLGEGEVVVLFDGLDEVNEESSRRSQLTTHIQDFTNKWDKCSYVITCRIAASNYSFEKFKYVEVADFTEYQVKQFSGKWFSVNPYKGFKFIEELEKKENKGLKELARTPLLLTLLCIAFDENLCFPPRRVELYEEALDALLKKWDSSRNIKRDEIYRDLSLGRKRQLFSVIAAETYVAGNYFIKQKVIEQKIKDFLETLPVVANTEEPDPEAILKAIESQHGILIERANLIYSFSHLTFQEYYTAKYIVDNTGEGSIDALMKHISEDKWREVFLLTVSMLGNADSFFKKFSDELSEQLERAILLKSAVQWARIKSISTYKESHQAVMILLLSLAVAAITSERSLYGINITTNVKDNFLKILDYTLLNGEISRDITKIVKYMFGKPHSFLNFLNNEGRTPSRLDRQIFEICLLISILVGLKYIIYHTNDKKIYLLLSANIKLLKHISLTDSNLIDKFIIFFPMLHSKPSEWQEFHDRYLEYLATEHSMFFAANVDVSQGTNLYNYLVAVNLYYECLQLASVRNRPLIFNLAFRYQSE